MAYQYIHIPETVTLRDALKGHQASLPNEVVGRMWRMRHTSVYHHRFEVRLSGEDYHEHCFAVEEGVRQIAQFCPTHLRSPYGEEEQEAANGHDLFETLLIEGGLEETRQELLGFISPRVVFLVDALTKYDKDIYWERMLELNQIDPWVILIKYPDRLHNERTIRSFSPEKQHMYLLETKNQMLPMCLKAQDYIRYSHPELYPIYRNLYRQLYEKTREEMARVLAEKYFRISLTGVALPSGIFDVA